MKIPGLVIQDALSMSVLNSDMEVVTKENIKCEAIVRMDTIYLQEERIQSKVSRPYLHMSGYAHEIRGKFDDNVNSLKFNSDNKIRVSYNYRFNNDELADLVLKGLYEPGFRTPSEFLASSMELPITCDAKVVRGDESNYPIVIVNVKHSHNIDIDQESSGYDLADYFEHQAVISDKHTILTQEDELNVETNYEDTLEQYIKENLKEEYDKHIEPIDLQKEIDGVEIVDAPQLTDVRNHIDVNYKPTDSMLQNEYAKIMADTGVVETVEVKKSEPVKSSVQNDINSMFKSNPQPIISDTESTIETVDEFEDSMGEYLEDEDIAFE